MTNEDFKVKLTISSDKLEEINDRMESIMDVKIEEESGAYLIPNELFSDDKKINDVIRYFIEVDDSKVNLKIIEKTIRVEKDLDDYLKDYLKDGEKYKRIIIIIESPHRYEYTFDYKPIGPAQGKTGIMIEKNIDEILELYKIKQGKYVLIICNPVQFQTSLGIFYFDQMINTIRDNIWTKMYKSYKSDFINRLKLYKPDYILNATTARRKARIKKAIEENMDLKNIIVEDCKHPSSWKNGNIR